MAGWRKNQEISNHQVGNRRSSSYNGKPPLDNRFSTWEKKFCTTVGAVPWRRVLEGKRYMELHPNVMKWEDSAVKQAFYEAKFRFWADINGFRCNIPLPDPDMYIDDVDWDASVDPELCLDLDREVEARRNMIENSEETEILGSSLELNHLLSGLGWGIEGIKPTGWGDDDDQEVVTKPDEETNSWEERESQRWIPQEHYGGDLDSKYEARNGKNINWGGYNRRRENNISWSKNLAYYNMSRDRRNGGRGGGGTRRNNIMVNS